MERFSPEVDALLGFLLFNWTVLQNQPTPGMALQNLMFTQSSQGNKPAPVGRKILLLRGIVDIGGRYLISRLRRMGLKHGWSEAAGGSLQRKTWSMLNWIDKLQRVSWLLNTLIFLKSGTYPTVLDRLLGMQLVNSKQLTAPRAINFQFMNRQILWDYFSGFLLFVAPLVDWNRIRMRIIQKLQQGRSSRIRRFRRNAEELPASTRPEPCAVCNNDPAQTPYITSCHHTFCYYCLRSACTKDVHFRCPKCGCTVDKSVPWISSI